MAHMFSSALVISLVTILFVSSCSAGWVLQDDYTPANWWSKFSFFTDADPTHGTVTFVDEATAQKSGLINTNNNQVYMGVDSTNLAPNGRASVRITSNTEYSVGSLVVLDLAHMPVGCGTWPAFWTVGQNWPAGGEIDIIEGVHNQATNAMTLHTADGCSITNNNAFSGTIKTSNCFVDAAGQSTNEGCSIGTTQTNTYGSGLNAASGGVYAMAWTAASISIWFFPRSAIPADITAGNPTQTSWGEPLSQFQGGCNIPQMFTNNQLVLDTTFCGDWAGNVWSTSGCSSTQYPTCESYVENNPTAFKNAFWSINSLKVYTQSTGTVSETSSVATTTANVPATTAYKSAITTDVSTHANDPVTTAVVATQSQGSIGVRPSSASEQTSHRHHTETNNDGNIAVVTGLVSDINVEPSTASNNDGNIAVVTGIVGNINVQASTIANTVASATATATSSESSGSSGSTDTTASSSTTDSTSAVDAVVSDGVVMEIPDTRKVKAREANAQPVISDGSAVRERKALVQREQGRRVRHLKKHVKPVGLRHGHFRH